MTDVQHSLDVANISAARDALARRAEMFKDDAESPSTADDDRQWMRQYAQRLADAAGELTALLADMGEET